MSMSMSTPTPVPTLLSATTAPVPVHAPPGGKFSQSAQDPHLGGPPGSGTVPIPTRLTHSRVARAHLTASWAFFMRSSRSKKWLERIETARSSVRQRDDSKMVRWSNRVLHAGEQ